MRYLVMSLFVFSVLFSGIAEASESITNCNGIRWAQERDKCLFDLTMEENDTSICEGITLSCLKNACMAPGAVDGGCHWNYIHCPKISALYSLVLVLLGFAFALIVLGDCAYMILKERQVDWKKTAKKAKKTAIILLLLALVAFALLYGTSDDCIEYLIYQWS